MSYVPYIPELAKWTKITKPITGTPVLTAQQKGKGDVELVNPIDEVVVRAKAALREKQKEEGMSPAAQSRPARRRRRSPTKTRKTKPRKRVAKRRKTGKKRTRTVKRANNKGRRFG